MEDKNNENIKKLREEENKQKNVNMINIIVQLIIALIVSILLSIFALYRYGALAIDISMVNRENVKLMRDLEYYKEYTQELERMIQEK